MESKDTTDLLIQEVRHRPLLWDRTLKEYHNASLSNQNWDEVAEATGLTRAVAKQVWSELERCFLREAESNTSSWVYYTRLQFLKPVLETPAKRRLGEKKNYREPSIDEDEYTYVKMGSTSKEREKRAFALERKKRLEESGKLDDKSGEQTLKEIKAIKQNFLKELKSNNDDISFFRSIMPYFKLMDRKTKLKVQNKIYDCVMEGEEEDFEDDEEDDEDDDDLIKKE